MWVRIRPDGNIEYQQAHRNLGSVKGKTCRCGNDARHWAYLHNDPDELVSISAGSMGGLVYSVKPECYEAMCVPCHRRHDYLHKGSKCGHDQWRINIRGHRVCVPCETEAHRRYRERKRGLNV